MSRPHLAWPFILIGGRAATVEQDSIDHVTQRCLMVLSVRVGTLIDQPEFGIPDQAHTTAGADLAVIRSAIDRWVPTARSSVTDTELVRMARTIGVKINTPGDADG